MIKIPLILLVLISNGLFAQRRGDGFIIHPPEKKVPHSLYNQISFIDSRHDTTNMGVVQLRLSNIEGRVIARTHLSVQLAELLNALNDSAAEDGKLLLQLRHFTFAESAGVMAEKGLCYLKAELYAHTNSRYQKIAVVDTVIKVARIDVTRALFRGASKTISDFLAYNLHKKPDSTSPAWSYNEVKHMDIIEKRPMRLYSAKTLTDGIYGSYASFASQVPDHQAVVEVTGDRITNVRIKEENGETDRIRSKNIYAVVHQGLPYIKTDYGYYPLTRRNNDYFFIGRARMTSNSDEVMNAAAFYGFFGAVIATQATASFEMKIDHLNGGFIRIRERELF